MNNTAKISYSGKRWSENEITYIKDHVIEKTTEEIAKDINRTPGAVRSLITRMRLQLNHDNKEYAERMNKRLRRKEHLCWYCARACGNPMSQCSWAHGLIPVSGWKTKHVPGFLEENGLAVKRFKVVACPLYKEG